MNATKPTDPRLEAVALAWVGDYYQADADFLEPHDIEAMLPRARREAQTFLAMHDAVQRFPLLPGDRRR